MRTDHSSALEVEVRDTIAYATINGEGEMNRYGMGASLYLELGRLGATLRDSPDIRALVVTGKGDFFSLGNVPTTTAGHVDSTLGLRRSDLGKNVGRQYIDTFFDLDVPVITALNGPVMAGILAFVLLSDVIVAEEHATIRDVHMPLGSPSATGPYLWPLAVGLTHAKRYLLTGDRLTAQEAERIGLFTEVVPRGESLRRATEYATQLAALSPAAVGGTKRALNQWLKAAFPTVFDTGLFVEFLGQHVSGVAHESLADLQEEELAHLRGSE